MADNINTRAIVYDMLMSVSGQEGQSVYQQTFQRNIGI